MILLTPTKIQLLMLIMMQRRRSDVIQAVKICATQGFTLREHRDNSTDQFSRVDNFIAILKSFAEIDTVLIDNLENGPKND